MEGAEKFLDCFPTCDLCLIPLHTFGNTKGRQTVLFPFATETVEPENGNCFFPVQTASATFLKPEL